MQIQNVEALKSWLTSRLEPICDADPAALAKYVVALVKKDKPIQELKHVCKDQLEVFLSDETNNFVEVLFESLESHSYLPQTIVEPKPALSPKEKKDKTPKTSLSDDLNTSKSVIESCVPDDDERDFRRTRKNTDNSSKESINETQSDQADRSRKRRAEDDSHKDQAKVPKEDTEHKPDSDDLDLRKNGDSQPIPSTLVTTRDNNRDRERRYQNRRDRDFSLGRNEDDERFRRGGSSLWNHRGRDRDRDRDVGRPRDRHHDGIQRYGHKERKARCRDYEEKGFCIRGELCVFDHGNDPVVIQDMPMMPGFPAQGPFMHGAPQMGSIPVPPPPLLGVPPDNFPRPPNQPPPPGTGLSKSDGSETQKGPTTDHPKGTLPDTTPVCPVSSMQQPVSGPLPPPAMVMPPMDGGVRPFIPMPGPPRPPRPPFPVTEDTYNPEQPQFERLPVWMRVGVPRPPAPVVPYNPNIPLQSRELITVPPSQLTVQVTADKPSGESNRLVIGPDKQNQQITEPEKVPNNFQSKPVWRKLNDTLEIKKVPREFNNITKLNEYFKTFGNIVNIQVNAFGDGEAALITFSKHSEAKTAYTCPDAVLGNRFIRVFWHQPDNNQSSGKGGSKTEANKVLPAKPTMFQSGKTTFVRQEKPVTTAASDTTTETMTTLIASVTTVTTETTAATTTPVLAVTTITARHQQRQDIMKKKLEIQKQKQELLDKQIQQQKLLISKLEKKNLAASEKDNIMKTLKSLSKNIESIKQEIELAAMTAKSKQSPSQARQLAQKAILDQELDLITHQHSGEDTTELKKKVEELKQEAKSLGLLDGPVKGRGLGNPRGRGGRGRGRGRGRGSRVWTKESGSLDAYSKQISVAHINPTDKDDILEHFMDFGNVDAVEYDGVKCSLILTFRSRKEAEIAFKAKKLKDKILQLSWYKPPVPTPVNTVEPKPTTSTPQLRHSRSSTLSSTKLDDEDLGLDFDADLDKHDDVHDDDEALLLGEDFDEEEEDEEDRSWRR